jgi:HPt (histidine-containing phosphotransfer) domain-containing protein
LPVVTSVEIAGVRGLNMSEPLFDENKFLQSLAGDVELARELLSAFLEDSPERSDSLSEALAKGDADQASKMAHSLKGMCGVVRSTEIATLALGMEESAKAGNLEKTRELHALFLDKLTDAHSAMRLFLARD